jgi:hypothetical protein
LKATGYNVRRDIIFLPISGLNGTNIFVWVHYIHFLFAMTYIIVIFERS